MYFLSLQMKDELDHAVEFNVQVFFTVNVQNDMMFHSSDLFIQPIEKGA